MPVLPGGAQVVGEEEEDWRSASSVASGDILGGSYQ